MWRSTEVPRGWHSSESEEAKYTVACVYLHSLGSSDKGTSVSKKPRLVQTNTVRQKLWEDSDTKTDESLNQALEKASL